MAKLYNLARMTTATTGTGTITLGTAVTSWLSFASAGVQDGETITYAISDGNNREIGRGVYTSSGTTLTRYVLKSTNSDSPISLSGSAQVLITPAAGDIGPSMYRQIMSDTPTQSSTGLSSWFNQSTSTVSDTAVGMTLKVPAGVTGISGLYKSASGINSVTALISPTSYVGSGGVFPGFEFGFYDGTKTEGVYLPNGGTSNYLQISRRATVTSSNTVPLSWQGYISYAPLWVKLYVSGGNLTYGFSLDGVNFVVLRTNAITEHLSNADNIYFAAAAPTGDNIYATIMSWTQT